MARLLLKSNGLDDLFIELKLGVNRLGRSPANDFAIDDPTVSARHCEIALDDKGIRVHDCDSTNGTYIDGQPVSDGRLVAGQVLRLGEIELLVESTNFNIAIPRFELPCQPAPPVVLSDGSLICPRHVGSQARYQCTHCREVMCETCVHRLRRRGGKFLTLCPLCSHQCELIGGEKKTKRPLFAFLRETIKLHFFPNSRTQA